MPVPQNLGAATPEEGQVAPVAETTTARGMAAGMGRWLVCSDTAKPGTTAANPAKRTLIWLESNATATGSVVPFWLRANRFGSVPMQGMSGSFIAHAEKKYDQSRKRFFDWGFSLEGRANLGQTTEAVLIEGHAKLKLGAFELRGGRTKEAMGLADSSLSSGSFSISGNALGIPKVEIRVPEFTHLLGGKLFAFKGNLAHGWIGDIQTNRQQPGSGQYLMAGTYFHQKSLYGRLGKESWKLRFYGGFNHQVFWGDEEKRFGYFNLSDKETFLYVLTGRMYKGTSSKIGNHLGTIDLGLELNLKNTKVMLYRQNFYEVGGLYYLANIQDGLHGLSVTRKTSSRAALQVKKILFEFLYTKNQAGEPWSRNTPTGAENYYNNSEYNKGWSYKGLALGTPFLTTRANAKEGVPGPPYDYFVNNRVVLFHTGLEASVGRLRCTMKLSYSKNYGTWRTSLPGYRSGGPAIYTIPPTFGLFIPVNQFSGLLDLALPLKDGLLVGGAVALDRGDLLENSAGAQLRFIKNF